ncbi:MAG: hypothetical protein HOO91_20565 [Bacteroidales bacterium]|nr:hypothetical protein [Bacteroidales bacterium]
MKKISEVLNRNIYVLQKKYLTLLLILFFLVLLQACKNSQLYKDPKIKIEDRIENLISQMTLDEKLEQLAGIGGNYFDTKENERLGIPAFRMTDGPHGVRWLRATSFPCGVAIAATWDTALVAKYAGALAVETKARGRNYLLGPCVNIHRLAIGGRNFESYGEDPWLTSRLAVSYVKALQYNHVIPSIKHFALNNQEWYRTEVNVTVDERTMREIYLPSFEAAVKEADVWTVMSAYNKVNGWWCSENKELLTDILKNDWGFKGLVVSDWVSTHSTEFAANNGLDIEMPTGDVFAADKLKKLLNEGKISEKTIDDKVHRILRVKFLAGLFDNTVIPDTMVLTSDNHKQLALEVAKESIVLLKNQNDLLPLDLSKLHKIAVIGPNATEMNTGGGSSRVNPFYAVSPLQGIKNLVGKNIEIMFAQGDVMTSTPLEPINEFFFKPTTGIGNGLTGEYFSNKELLGAPILTRTDSKLSFIWNDKAPAPNMSNDNFSIRWTGILTPPVTRKYAFYTASDDGVRLFLDGRKIIDNWKDHGTTIDTAYINLEAGKPYDIKVEYYENAGSEALILGWDLPIDRCQNKLITEAVKAAKSSDVAIIFAGSSEFIESEGFDRKDGLALSGQQNELIKAVSEANSKTIVVLNTGTSVITKSWLNSVPALLETFFSGQEGGNAIAQVLFGMHNPSAKLPFSFISDYDQSPAFKGYMDKKFESSYSEGIFVGYRYLEKNKITPTFPFGFGLSYTNYEYSALKVEPLDNGTYIATLKVKNIGKVAGSEIVQLYVSDKHSSVPRPEKELKGFVKVELTPGEEKQVSFLLNSRSFAYYDIVDKNWKVESGKFELLVGSSSIDIRQKAFIEIK